MIRKVIQIDEDKCNGCGLCASACHEGAIEIIDGKAKLVSDSYCDGLGDCLPSCPQGAISFVEREAEAYDEEAVKARMQQRAAQEAGQGAGQGKAAVASAGAAAGVAAHHHAGGGCPGAAMRTFDRSAQVQAEPTAVASSAVAHAGGGCPGAAMRSFDRGAQNHAEQPLAAPAGAAPTTGAAPVGGTPAVPSQLANWPVQIKLAPVEARYFDGANLLVAADCCAFAYGNFHQDFIRNKVCLIGCPKLDGTDYSEKLTQIIANNDIKSLTITRMEVPCCGGLENMAKMALQASGKFIPWQVVTFSLDGRILD